MRNINNLTVIICSYKANKEFKLCLHQLARYGFTANQLLIFENSPNDYISNREMLNNFKIRYFNNPGGMHAATINYALMNVITTDYALILDSDCFLTTDPIPYFERVKEHKIQLFGDIVGDRAGLHIHKRIQPCWCFIDVTFLKQNNILFTDFERMAATDSMSFIDRTMLSNARDPKKYYYNAGSTMYEDVVKCGGIVADVGEAKPYIHIEGASWRREFDGYKEIVAAADNWVTLLYPKLMFEEKYLNMFAYTEQPAEEPVQEPATVKPQAETPTEPAMVSEQVSETVVEPVKTEEAKVEDAIVVEPQQVEENIKEPTEEKKHDKKTGKKKDNK